MPGLYTGTKALLLKDPIIRKGIGLFWVKTETTIPITKITEEVGRALAKNSELQTFLYHKSTASAGQHLINFTVRLMTNKKGKHNGMFALY